MSARVNYKMYPTDYVQELNRKAKREKARAFMEYQNDSQHLEVNSIGFYAKSWNKSKSTVHEWVKEFKTEIERFHTYWMIHNTQHYTSVENKNERLPNDNKTTTERKKDTTHTNKSNVSNTVPNDNKTTTERLPNKEFNSNINNIYVESDDSDNDINSKEETKEVRQRNAYTNNFEIIWNEYDKKSGNKKRAFALYKKRFGKVDIKIIIAAIRKYKELKENFRDLKDFDGFLNGMIDTYIPRRAWVIDNNGIRHTGLFFDCENILRLDNKSQQTLSKEKIAELLEQKRFGYAA